MYKKKLGVRVVTAITVGSLLCSNASVAMAAEEVSSIINEHTGDAEKAETSEEEVTETEEVVEETTEAKTEEVVEETTEAETEEVVEETTEAETEEVVEETTEAETDEEELENDFEEVELEAEVALMTAKAPEEELAGVNNEKTIYFNFHCADINESVAGTVESITVSADKKFFTQSELEEYLPDGYTFEEEGITYELYDGNEYLYVGIKKIATKKVYVSYIDEKTKQPFENGIEEIKVAADATSFNTSILTKVPAGYELCVTGDITFEGDTVNVEVRKTAEAAEKTVYVSYIDEETKIPFENGIEEIKVAADATSFNTSILKKVPAGYELCVTGDIAFEGDTVNVEVRKKAVEEKTVYVSYIDEETKIPFENGIEVIKVAKDATYFHTSVLTEVPAGYELCNTGDVYIGENDTVNVEVRKKAVEEKTVYVSYIDEETKIPFENGIEVIKVAKDATYFHTSVLTEVPAGYELCAVGDVYIGENDTVNVEVRKKATVEEKTVYVSYIDEETKIPFENGIEAIKVAADATYFNTSVLKEVPAGYELCVVGDVYIGENDTVNVEVRKKTGETPDEKTAVLNIIYKAGDVEVGREKVTATGEEGEAYTFTIKDLTVPAGYALAPSFEDITVEFGASKDVVVEVVEESKVFAANLYVTYKDGDVVVGHSDAVASGLAGGSYIFRIHELKVPEGYVLAEAFNGIEVPYGKTYNIVLQVKKLNPEEMADATLHISYIFNYKEIASEDITVRGKKGESYTFTSENVNLNIPSGYKLKKAMEPTEVQFGETYAITLDLTRRSSGGGSGSSGGGSGSGSGSRSVGTANKLTNGRWILDSVGWWYPFSDNTYAKGGWYYLEWQNKKDWYYFDANGYLVSGWFEENGNKYYLHDVHDGTFGRMYSGWNKIGNQWYYFNDTTTGTFGALDPNAQVPAELLNQ